MEVTNESYEPRIVIEGFLQPHHKVDKIRVASNFRIDANLNEVGLLPDPNKTHVVVVDEQTGRNHRLSFHVSKEHRFDDYYWEYRGNDLIIEYGHTYTLKVETMIGTEELHAEASTTVPQSGMRIQSVNADQLMYREKDESGNTRTFQLNVERSPGITFYIMTVSPTDARADNFIYDNPYVELDTRDVEENLDDFSYSVIWNQDIPHSPGNSEFDVYWFNFWFYSEYRIIVYAADDNYRRFMQTFNNVQENDGNFHEPEFNVKGDGIGIFGSVIADTTYIRVVKE